MANSAHISARGANRSAVPATMADRLAPAFAISAGVTSALSALLVVLKETNEDTVLAWMKAATGHHWVSHGIVDLLLFVVIGILALRSVDRLEERPGLSIGTLIGGVAFGALIVVGFFAL